MVKKIIIFGTASLFCLMFIAYSCNNNQNPTTKSTGTTGTGTTLLGVYEESIVIDPSLPVPAMYASLVAWDGITLTPVTPVNNVYEVSTPEQLAWVISQTGNFAGQTISIMENIDLDNQAFNGLSSFAGTFDGNNKTIYNININRSTESDVGLINELQTGGIVKDLALNEGNITGDGSVGAFVGINNGANTMISNVANYNVTVSGNTSVGGIIGRTGSTILIADAVNSGTITSTAFTAGILGRSTGTGTIVGITRVRNSGIINGGGGSGGIAGSLDGNTVTITDAGNTGNITGADSKAGLVGYITGNTTANINNSYNYATVSAGTYIGNLGGMLGGSVILTVNDTYYRNNLIAFGFTNALTTITDNSAELSTADFASEASFPGFDFVNVWTMGDGYPIRK